jgi:AT hook motif
MAERVLVVCDTCGNAATERVTFKAGGKGYQRDFCAEHLAELVSEARPAKRGRAPRMTSVASKRAAAGNPTPKKRGRPRKVTAEAGASASTQPKRRGRPPKVATQAALASSNAQPKKRGRLRKVAVEGAS